MGPSLTRFCAPLNQERLCFHRRIGPVARQKAPSAFGGIEVVPGWSWPSASLLARAPRTLPDGRFHASRHLQHFCLFAMAVAPDHRFNALGIVGGRRRSRERPEPRRQYPLPINAHDPRSAFFGKQNILA